MAKIKVEIEVPKDCVHCKFYTVLTGRCDIFGSILKESSNAQHFMIERCDKCKAAEIKDTTKNCKECDHRYGNTCNLFDRELTSYGNVIDDNWGYIRCNECKQAEVQNGEDTI